MNEDRSEYIIPSQCECCGSSNIAVRVLWNKGITRYVCVDCSYARSVAKEINLKKRTNTSVSTWAARTIKHHPFCVICGSKDDLEAHHIIPVSHSRKYMYVDTNGITLCKRCHYLVHNKATDERREE